MKKKFLLLLTSLLTLVSCDIRIGDIIFSGLNNDSQTSSSSYEPESISISIEEGNNYYLASNLKYSFRDTNGQYGWYTSYSTGEQKVLVVPVDLADYSNTSKGWNVSKLQDLNTAFFGNSEDTTFESVKNYFYKSSYGKLNLTGEVTSVFTSKYTYNQINNYGESGGDYVADEFYKSADASLLKQYDLDNDGYIDNCIFIYSNNYDYDSSFWAWCTYKWPVENPNHNKPAVNNYMWASYHFMKDYYSDYYNYGKVETHTYIHEMGHMLGLDDYYCYDENYSWDPAGKLDMQSYNVGDHNAYSKMALGWIDPFVVTGSCEINLKTSAKYPQAILINDNWNGSSFDEYLLIEYYTPSMLNQVDALHDFSGDSKMYNYNGLRIYHIDARIVKTTADSQGSLNPSSNYVDVIGNENEYYYLVGASNSYTYSNLPSSTSMKYRYVHLLDQAGNNRLNGGYGGNISTSSALWTGSKVFTPSSVFFANGTKFNDNSTIGYSIAVSDLTDEECKVTITKL